jgi:hypothetical protein
VVRVARRVQRVERARVDGGRAAEDALQGQEALLRAVDDALEVAVAADGPGERHGLQAELGLDVVQDPERLDARAVGLVGEGDDGQPADLAGREELPGALLHAAVASSTMITPSTAASARNVSWEKSSWPGVSIRLRTRPPCSRRRAVEETEIPRAARAP